MPKFSVVICCANSADTLEQACQSVAWADELVIVDSGSKDRTQEIGRKYATRYVIEPWRGYTKQKQYGASLAKNDWVFVLDGDECCSPELAKELAALTQVQLDAMDVYLIKRRNFVMGRYVRAWDPDWQSRIIHRTRCIWADEVLHDARLASHPSRLGRLNGWIEHKRFSDSNFKDYFNGSLEDSRLLMVARDMYGRGKRCTVLDLWFRPIIAFVKFYFLKRAFLDGAFGLLIGQKAYQGAQLKYAALWYVQEVENAGTAK